MKCSLYNRASLLHSFNDEKTWLMVSPETREFIFRSKATGKITKRYFYGMNKRFWLLIPHGAIPPAIEVIPANIGFVPDIIMINHTAQIPLPGHPAAVIPQQEGQFDGEGIIQNHANIAAFHAAMLDDMKFRTAKPNLKKIDPAYLQATKVGDIYKYSPLSKYTGLTGKTPVRADTTYVGVEIELESVKYDDIGGAVWNVMNDGSLRNNGKEFVTIPIQVKYLEVELNRLFNSLKSKRTSSRCSVHVHLNARDFSLEEMKAFFLLYMIYERSLYRFAGDRWNNNFCIPVHAHPAMMHKIISEIDCRGTMHNTGWHKYFGFNVCPIFGGESKKIGTLEFRQLAGTTDTLQILRWINLIVSLKITAKKIPFKDLLSFLKVMNEDSSYTWLTKTTFRDFAPFLLDSPMFKDDIETCIAKTKYIFLDDEKGEAVIKFKPTTMKGNK